MFRLAKVCPTVEGLPQAGTGRCASCSRSQRVDAGSNTTQASAGKFSAVLTTGAAAARAVAVAAAAAVAAVAPAAAVAMFAVAVATAVAVAAAVAALAAVETRESSR